MSPDAMARLRDYAETPAVFFKGPEREMIADLRALLDAHDTARAEGVAAERARVVAALVATADQIGDDKTGPVKIVLLNAAVSIERGEHEVKHPSPTESMKGEQDWDAGILTSWQKKMMGIR